MKNEQEAKILALKQFLQDDKAVITESDNQNNLFVVNEREELRGNPPEYYQETIAEFKKMLSADLIKKITKVINNPRASGKVKENLRLEIKKLIENKPTIKDWGFNDNITYFLIFLTARNNPETSLKLRKAWNNEPIEDDRPVEAVNDGEYTILTDEEADEAWNEELDNYIDECLEIPDRIEPYFDREAWKRDARIDGRGHSLARYDGAEYSETVDGVEYFIYCQNK